MGVSVDQARHQDLVFTIHHIVGLVGFQDFCFRTDSQDAVPFHGERTGFVDVKILIHSQDGSVGKDEVSFFHGSP